MSTLLNVIAHFETTLVDSIDENSVSMELQSIETPSGNIPDGTYGFTLEEESTSRREYCIGVLAAGVVTFTHRDISPLDATTIDASGDSARQKHRKGQSVKLTNFPALQRIVRLLDGTDDLDAAAPLKYDGAVTPVDDNELTTKAWVLSVITGGAVTTDQVIVTGDAGETVAAEDYVYLNPADGKWYIVDATDSATLNNVKKGIAQGAGTTNNAISGGIILVGHDKQQSYTAGQLYYAQDGGGALGTSAGTNEFAAGVGDLNGRLLLLDGTGLSILEKQALAGGNALGTPSNSNKFITEDLVKSGGTGEDGALDVTSNTTITTGGTVYGDYVVFNYTTMNIDTGMTLDFGASYQNKIIILLCQGDATLHGTIDLDGMGGEGGALEQDGVMGANNFLDSNGKCAVDNTTNGIQYLGGSAPLNALIPFIGCGSGGGGGLDTNGVGGGGEYDGGIGGDGGGAILIAVAGTADLSGLHITAQGINGTHASNDTNTSFLSSRPATAGAGGGGGFAAIFAKAFAEITTPYTFDFSGGIGGNGSSGTGSSGGSPPSGVSPATPSAGSSTVNDGGDGLISANLGNYGESRDSGDGGEGIGYVGLITGASPVLNIVL